MTNRKSTKRALLSSVLALVVCIAMLVGSTFAWFTDNASTAVNTIQAGNLDVELEMLVDGKWESAEGKTLKWITTDNVDNVLWEPGCTYKLPTLRIVNKGNLALKYQVLITGIVGDAELLDVITFNGLPDTNVSLLPDDEKVFTIEGHMAETAGNKYMNKQINDIAITVIATQDTVESDSDSSDYDKDATYPAVDFDEKTNEELVLTADIFTVTVPANADEGVYKVVAYNKDVETTAGESTLSFNLSLLKDSVKVAPQSGVSYEVEIFVGKNLDITDVKHNGASIVGFGYDINTGIVSFATDFFSPFEIVYKTLAAKVGNANYYTIDEAIANWTNNTTLTLLNDVTLTDVVNLKSTEHHILNLDTYTLTAASGKNAFEIIACGTGSAERNAITVRANKNNPGGINAGNKSVIYYDYSKGKISTEDRPIIKIEGGVLKGSTTSFLTGGIYVKGTAARKCATINVTGGTLNCSILGTGKSKLLISGGTFNHSVGSQGDSTALRLISGGKFKSFGFMTADSNNTKFWIGTKMGVSDVGVYIDENNYLVVGGPVITEAGDKFKDPASSYSSWSYLLQYSSAKDYGLYYVK